MLMPFNESQFGNPRILPTEELREIEKELDSENRVSLSQLINKVTSQEIPSDIASLLKKELPDSSAGKSEEIKEKDPQLVELGREYYSDFEKIRSTFRGFEEICRVLDLEKEKFKNKTVLDVGSGYGGLALDLANLPELKTKIISLDPRYTKEYFQQSLTFLREKCKRAGVNPPETEKELSELKKKFNITESVTLLEAAEELRKMGQPIIAGSAENLPFKDKSFDMVLSSYAIPTVIEDNPELIQKTIQEIGRVLKIRGEAYLGPITDELKSLIEDFSFNPNIRREFHGSKETKKEAARYSMDAGWTLVLRKLNK